MPTWILTHGRDIVDRGLNNAIFDLFSVVPPLSGNFSTDALASNLKSYSGLSYIF